MLSALPVEKYKLFVFSATSVDTFKVELLFEINVPVDEEAIASRNSTICPVKSKEPVVIWVALTTVK